MKSNLKNLNEKLSKQQILDALKAKNVKGGKNCPPPNAGVWKM